MFRSEENVEDYIEIINVALNSFESKSCLHSVHYSSSTKKLILRLRDDIKCMELETLQLDTVRLEQTHDGSIVRGVSITKKVTSGDNLGEFSLVFSS